MVFLLVKLTNLMVKPIYIIHPKVCWYGLSLNLNAIHLLEQNLRRVYWNPLSRKTHAIYILKENLDKVDWFWLSRNPNAIHLLEQNQNVDKINWSCLSENPNAIHLFAKLDYIQMRLNNPDFVQDLVAFVCNPNWIQKCANRLNMGFEEYQDLLSECNVI